MWQDSWAGAVALCVEVGWNCTVVMLIWCSTHQLTGCECTVKVSSTPFGRIYAAYVGMYSYMQPYIYAFKCIYKLKIYIYALMYLFACLYTPMCSYIHIYMYIGAHRCISTCM